DRRTIGPPSLETGKTSGKTGFADDFHSSLDLLHGPASTPPPFSPPSLRRQTFPRRTARTGRAGRMVALFTGHSSANERRPPAAAGVLGQSRRGCGDSGVLGVDRRRRRGVFVCQIPPQFSRGPVHAHAPVSL